MDDEHKRRLAEGRARYYESLKGENKMPFMKRRVEEDEPPAERVERTERIVNEARGHRLEPEYTETEEMVEDEPAPRKQAPQKTSEFTVKYSVDEMRLDMAAHMVVVNAANDSLLRSGMPPHLATAMVQSICSGHIQRMKDIEQVLKQYGN